MRIDRLMDSQRKDVKNEALVLDYSQILLHRSSRRTGSSIIYRMLNSGRLKHFAGDPLLWHYESA